MSWWVVYLATANQGRRYPSKVAQGEGACRLRHNGGVQITATTVVTNKAKNTIDFSCPALSTPACKLMMRVVCSLFCISTLVRTIAANVEKTIFLGPSAIQIPRQHPTIADLQLQTLTPDASKIRANVTASFSSPENPDGTISWYLLEGLTTGQRYEVRICWAATVRHLRELSGLWLTTQATNLFLTGYL